MKQLYFYLSNIAVNMMLKRGILPNSFQTFTVSYNNLYNEIIIFHNFIK